MMLYGLKDVPEGRLLVLVLAEALDDYFEPPSPTPSEEEMARFLSSWLFFHGPSQHSLYRSYMNLLLMDPLPPEEFKRRVDTAGGIRALKNAFRTQRKLSRTDED